LRQGYGWDVGGAVQARVTGSRRALLTTPAPLPSAMFMKWEVLDQLMINEADAGMHTDNRVIVAVAAIEADVLRFGLNDSELGSYGF
jgi:hypothetical protein